MNIYDFDPQMVAASTLLVVPLFQTGSTQW
jgi:hypothetical protein